MTTYLLGYRLAIYNIYQINPFFAAIKVIQEERERIKYILSKTQFPYKKFLRINGSAHLRIQYSSKFSFINWDSKDFIKNNY